MKFSIVIPCYNNFRFLEETINSCLNQTYKNFEIILVDDGSSSDIEPYIEKFKNQIKLIKKQNGGQGSARNLGIRNSSGQWIVPLDSDDTIPENFLEIALKNISDENDIIVSSQIHINANGALTGGNFTSMIACVPGYMNASIISTNIVGSNTSVFSRKIFNIIDGYEEHDRKIFEDWDLWTKAFFAGANFKGDANLKYFYRLHDKNEWVGNQDSSEMLARVEYHKKMVIEKYGILGEKFKNNLKSKINHDTNRMKIFIVNLKRSTDRKKFMIEQFDRLGITNYEFFEAFDGVNNNYSDHCDTFNYILNMQRVPTGAEIGCALSHVGLMQKVIALNEPCIILEDDALLLENLNNIGIIDFEFDVIFLNKAILFNLPTCDIHLSPFNNAFDKIDLSRHKFNPTFWHTTVSYIISPQGARKVLAAQTPIKHTADSWYYFGLDNAFRCKTPFIRQNREELASNINDNNNNIKFKLI